MYVFVIHKHKKNFQIAPLLFVPQIKILELYHGVTSSFFGIGILPVSDLLGGRYFWSVLLGV
jgi:hypothetical protein